MIAIINKKILFLSKLRNQRKAKKLPSFVPSRAFKSSSKCDSNRSVRERLDSAHVSLISSPPPLLLAQTSIIGII